MENKTGSHFIVKSDTEKIGAIRGEPPQPKSVGNDWSFKYDFGEDLHMYEYYMRRGKKLYFRNRRAKIVIDDIRFARSFLSEKPRYGQEFKIKMQY